jgi:hypothetical protein
MSPKQSEVGCAGSIRFGEFAWHLCNLQWSPTSFLGERRMYRMMRCLKNKNAVAYRLAAWMQSVLFHPIGGGDRLDDGHGEDEL